ncbi:polysaccharide deacetylase [Alkalihalobacillus trypoxylicola]|uniref:Polysaccharide deacetylase n=2 Tax=Alkalihalobacillus trypoxylicola TaxID=519424 RepID=A0A162FD70_9BACI|nr:polysaccharide deacetylase family protein [Alkalihalobacillus trypoxylicola]KYG35339.1 polysaccharide deacetylase [Alkalihalobacillus trypoxylicola]
MTKLLLFTVCLLLTACSYSQSMESDSESESEEVKETSEVEMENNDIAPEAFDSEKIEETEQEGEETTEEEEKERIYQINSNNWQVEHIEEGEENLVLLTIDDAPEHFSIEMAEAINQLDVHAIFFVNGHFLQDEAGKEKLKLLDEMGFEIGNHTINHPNLTSISEEEQYEEIVGLSDLIEEIIDKRPRFFRAPFGANTDYAKELVKEEGMTLMNWTFGADWEKEYMEKEALTDIMVESVHPGANLLFHDREWTNEALVDIIEGIQEKGYKFVDPQKLK